MIGFMQILADTGENMNYPYGMTWPGDGTAHRSSDGRNEVDYIGMLGIPSFSISCTVV